MGRRILVGLVALGCVAAAGPAAAQQARFGGQLSLAEDQDLGIGPRIQVELPQALSGLHFIGSFDLFFSDDIELAGVGTADQDYWEINANVAYGFEIVGLPGVEPYVGAGLNFAHLSVDFETPGVDESETDTRAGLNLLGGAQFPLTGITPFAEIRFEIEGGEQVPVLTGGFMIP